MGQTLGDYVRGVVVALPEGAGFAPLGLPGTEPVPREQGVSSAMLTAFLTSLWGRGSPNTHCPWIPDVILGRGPPALLVVHWHIFHTDPQTAF